MSALFFVLAALMIGAALAFVLVPLMRRNAASNASSDTARKRRALEEARALGLVDEREYAAKRMAIDGGDGANRLERGPSRSRTAFAAILAVALLLPASALLLYRLVGTPAALDPANLAPPTAAAEAANMEQAIAGLAAKLAQNPNDPQGWALLGRAYQSTDRFAESRDAFRKAHEQAPDNADLTVEYAQAIALASADHKLSGEPRTLLDGVLEKDPANQRALWLIGIGEYQDAKYDDAIATWKKLLPLLAPDSEVARSVRSEIADAEARRDGKTPPSDVASADRSAAPATPSAGATSPQNAAPAATLTVKVALDPALKDKLDPDATLFVFARAAKGPPMPLAIRKMKASDLPATVTLDDSMGMMPTMKLSMFPEVVVGARISKSGNAMAQSGDLETLSAPIDVHRSEPIALTIDRVVP